MRACVRACVHLSVSLPVASDLLRPHALACLHARAFVCVPGVAEGRGGRESLTFCCHYKNDCPLMFDVMSPQFTLLHFSHGSFFRTTCWFPCHVGITKGTAVH